MSNPKWISKLKKKLTNLTISRRRWLRGTQYDSHLHSPQNHKQCCLGFYMRDLGFPLAEINGRGTPSDVVTHLFEDSDCRVPVPGLVKKDNRDTTLCCKLINVNDSDKITDEVREAKITKLFAKMGVKVKFVD